MCKRTTIASLLPLAAIGNTTPILLPADGVAASVLLVAVFSSFAFDYVARQKVSSTSLNMFTMEQLPVLAPHSFERPCGWDPSIRIADWVAMRAGALSASSHELADALGYDAPVLWSPTRRLIWRTELDAAMFWLYGYSRDDAAYVMDTFPIVARNDRQADGLVEDDPNWRTKRLILAKYDELAEHARAGTTYAPADPPPRLPDELRLSVDTRASGG